MAKHIIYQRTPEPQARNHPARGFTLVELVVTIVILACLAAVAMPKFLDLQAQARYSTLQAMAGAMRAESEVIHGLALMAGQTGPTGSITISGTPILLVYGYPDAQSAGIGSTFPQVNNGYPLLALGGLTYFSHPLPVFRMGYGPITYTINTCYVEYLPATPTAPPDIFIYGDRYPNTVAPGPGPTQCQSSGGNGPG